MHASGGGQLKIEQRGIDVLEAEIGHIEPFEMGCDDLLDIVDGAEAPLAPVALGALEKCRQSFVVCGTDRGFFGSSGESTRVWTR